MHALSHRKLAVVIAALFALLAGCSHNPGKTVDFSHYFQQEHLGLSAGEPAKSSGKAAMAQEQSQDAVQLAESRSSQDPAVQKSREQAREGLSRNSAVYKGEFSDDYSDEGQPQVADPLKYWNIAWFYFNDALYTVLLRPLGKGYNYITPEPIRQGVLNFFYNLKFPIRFVNNLLQGKFTAAGVEMSRFLGNTLFGGLGVMDITEHKKAAAETPPEDFGQTLSSWGIGHGFYIVWPVMGPSSLRDSVGTFGDSFLDPISYIDPWHLMYDNPDWWSFTAAGVRTFVTTADRIESYDALYDAAIDPYISMRNAYIQNRDREAGR